MNNPAGIFNPYREPEPGKEDPKFLKKDADPEMPPSELRVRLDGDSFGVSFGDLDDADDDEIGEVSERLSKLLYEVNERFRAELRECGIKVLRPTIAYIAEPGEMVLRSKTAVIVVSTGVMQTEATAFRRIAHALHSLPVTSLLAKHKAKLHVRG